MLFGCFEFPESMELQENSIKDDELDEPANVFIKYIIPNVVGEFLTLLTHIILLQNIINIVLIYHSLVL
jgi:hypothetical protein